jgi:hypothetical protein
MQTKTAKKAAAVFAVMLSFVLLFALSACSAAGGKGQAAPTGEDLVIQVGDVSETVKFYPLTINGTRWKCLP